MENGQSRCCSPQFQGLAYRSKLSNPRYDESKKFTPAMLSSSQLHLAETQSFKISTVHNYNKIYSFNRWGFRQKHLAHTDTSFIRN